MAGVLPSVRNPRLSPASRVLHKAWRMLSGSDLDREATAAFYSKAFRQYRVDAVLAEYGTTGVQTLAACKRLGIPSIVHFHGFDASVHSVLEENAVTYPIMFREAAAIIAVSRAMTSKLVFLGARPERFITIPAGLIVDSSKAEIRQLRTRCFSRSAVS